MKPRMNGRFSLLKTSLFLFLLIPILLSSCGSYKKNTLFNSKYDVLADTAKTVYVANPKVDLYQNDYVIKAGDRVGFKNLNDLKLVDANEYSASLSENNVNGGYLVESDGSILLPVIGPLKIVGLTKGEARNAIQEAYEKKLLKSPLIDIYILNFSVTLLGEFNKQGKIYLTSPQNNLIDIIALASGIAINGDPTHLKIIRGDLKHPEIVYINLTDINSLANKHTIIQNNDLLYLPPKRSFIKSEAIRNNVNIIQPLLIILNSALIIYNFTR